MSSLSQHTEQAIDNWNVDGPDPVYWPGKNFELLADTREFVIPESVAEMLSAIQGSTRNWTVNKPEHSNLEHIYSVEQENSPWRVRARLACSGVHPEADYVDYALDFKSVLKTSTGGSYVEMEVTRGTLSEITKAIASGLNLIEDSFLDCCKIKTDYRIVPSREAFDQVVQRVMLGGNSS